MLIFGLYNHTALGKIVEKFSELKIVTSVLVCCEIAGNSKSFSDETHKNPANSKLRKQWLLKMKRKEFKPDKNSRICAVHFTEDGFRENLAIRRFLVLKRGCYAD